MDRSGNNAQSKLVEPRRCPLKRPFWQASSGKTPNAAASGTARTHQGLFGPAVTNSHAICCDAKLYPRDARQIRKSAVLEDLNAIKGPAVMGLLHFL
jgi:hypothetical protein